MTAVKNIGSRRELFVDDFLIQSTTAKLTLQKPTRKGVCFRFDGPYDGTGNCYPILVKDGDTLRMYYCALWVTSFDGKKFLQLTEDKSGAYHQLKKVYSCCIESKDGINWTRPSIGTVEYDGSKDNNIVMTGSPHETLVPFIDTNPACKDDERYKAFESVEFGTGRTHKSPDGYHWKPMPLHAPRLGYDGANVTFWDELRQKYWGYFRNWHDKPDWLGYDLDSTDKKKLAESGKGHFEAINDCTRGLGVCESEDYINWSKCEMLDFGGSPYIPLYNNSIVQYYRAPHIFMGFPRRYVERKSWSPSYDQLPDPTHRRNRMGFHPRHGLALTDCLFMSSRDGRRWKRTDEAYLAAGIYNDNNWIYGDCYLSVGMCETKAELKGEPNEISMYTMENHWKDYKNLCRYTIRQDGFMALCADAKGHITFTKLFTFDGRKLTLNVSTSAMGKMKVEMQDDRGKVIEGYSLSDCDEIFGDRLDYVVSWNGLSDVSSLAGKAIRMRFYMGEVNLFSFKFET